MAAPPEISPETNAALLIPEWVRLGLALLVVGAAVEIIGAVSPSASYMFAILLLLSFAAAGGQLEKVTDFLRTFGAITGPRNGGNP